MSFGKGYIYTVLAQMFGVGLQGVGAHLTLSMSGIFFMGFPVTFAISAYTYVLLVMNDFSSLGAFVGSMVASFLVGCVYALLYTKMSNDSFSVISLASILALDALLKSWDGLTGGVLGLVGYQRPELLKSMGMFVLFGGLLWILMLGFDWMVMKTPFGRNLRALKESSFLLESKGDSPWKVGGVVIVLASVLSGLAGVLEAWRLFIVTPVSFTAMINLIVVLTVAILAMKPQLRWLVGATLFVVILPESFRFLEISSTNIGHLRNILYGVMLVVLLKYMNANFSMSKRKV